MEIDDKPTEFSILDTVSFLEGHYGPDWRKNRKALAILFRQGRLFKTDHLIETFPEIITLWLYEGGDITKQESEDSFHELLGEITSSTKEQENIGKFGCAPVRDSYIRVMFPGGLKGT